MELLRRLEQSFEQRLVPWLFNRSIDVFNNIICETLMQDSRHANYELSVVWVVVVFVLINEKLQRTLYSLAHTVSYGQRSREEIRLFQAHVRDLQTE
jgi:hypothetical protein